MQEELPLDATNKIRKRVNRYLTKEHNGKNYAFLKAIITKDSNAINKLLTSRRSWFTSDQGRANSVCNDITEILKEYDYNGYLKIEMSCLTNGVFNNIMIFH